MTENNKLILELSLNWQSEYTEHSDRIIFATNNIDNLTLPENLKSISSNMPIDETVIAEFKPGSLIEYHADRLIQLPFDAIQKLGSPGFVLQLRVGRFYPQRIIAGVLNIDQHSVQPMRVVGIDDSSFTVDLNHPLSNQALQVGIRRINPPGNGSRFPKITRAPLIAAFHSGIGLQKTFKQGPDFYYTDTFKRQDSVNDAIFYQQRRMVDHIDQSASDAIRQIYQDQLYPGMRVLDLMSSWQSHLPREITELQVTGLGMNQAELSANNSLHDYIVHDLNQQPALPFSDDYFDVTLCSLSIEYLIEPLKVLKEVVRVTRPGGKILVSFSNRFFPTKAIAIWQELHPFERLGFVIDLFRRTPGLVDIKTESLQGQPRAANDIYSTQLESGDPVFVVSATIHQHSH